MNSSLYFFITIETTAAFENFWYHASAAMHKATNAQIA
jgi:hypothetical protein